MDKVLDKSFWNERYVTNDTGWDLGVVSPSIKAYADQLQDKNLRILIPGCGNSHEAEYLVAQGFTNVTVIDIAPAAVQRLQDKFEGKKGISVIEGDFFEHEGLYDLIIEQTFFCAIDRSLRAKYAEKMPQLLAPGGKLVGMLFASEFEKEGPPFGGSEEEYRLLFSKYFEIHTLELNTNSYPRRQGNELFINFRKSK